MNTAKFPAESLHRAFPNLQLVRAPELTREPVPPVQRNQRVMTPHGEAIVRSVRRNKSGIEGIDGQWMAEVQPEAANPDGSARSIETVFASECRGMGL